MAHPYSGKFIVIDGLDGIGKGVAQHAIVDYLKQKGKVIFDLHKYWAVLNQHPDFQNPVINGEVNIHYKNPNEFDVLVSAEPTFVGIGKTIREEITAKTGRPYSALTTAEHFAKDRLSLYKRVILPALEAGKIVIQARSVSTSIVYQPLQSKTQNEKGLSVDEILALEGNAFALSYAPDALIIPTIENVEAVMDRLKRREKDDNSRFENPEFQAKLKPLYEGEGLRAIFERYGTKVHYLDAGKSIQSTKEQAVDLAKIILNI